MPGKAFRVSAFAMSLFQTGNQRVSIALGARGCKAVISH